MQAHAHAGGRGHAREERLVEDELYVGEEGLFVTHYRGAGEDHVVIVPPWFEELPRTRKIQVNMARHLARRGLDVVRFDYHGTGLSAGDVVTLSSAREDLRRVIELCMTRGARRVHLLGFRMGGYVALDEAPDEGRVVLWEPVVDPRAYFEELLRREVTNQMVTFGKVKVPREELLKQLRARETITTDGYRMTPELHAELEEAPPLRLTELKALGQRLELLFWEDDKVFATATREGLSSRWCSSVKFSWRHIRMLEARSTELFDATTEALTRHA